MTAISGRLQLLGTTNWWGLVNDIICHSEDKEIMPQNQDF